LGLPDKSNHAQWFKNAIFPIAHPLSDMASPDITSSVFQDTKDMVVSIGQQKMYGSAAIQAYKIAPHPRWYHGGNKIFIKLHARKVRSQLKAALPQERFRVCPVFHNAEQQGYVAIWHGLPRNTPFLSTEPKGLHSRPQDKKILHEFESFNIVCSLPFALRLHLLSVKSIESDLDLSDNIKKGHLSVESEISTKASDDTLDALEFSLEEDVIREIEGFLTGSPLINSIDLSRTKPYNEFEVHFPRLSCLLRHESDGSGRPAQRILNIIRYSIASTFPQTKRQISRSFVIPIGQRRSHLHEYLTKNFKLALKSRGYKEADLKQFFTSVKSLHSRYESDKRNMSKIIQERNAKFTRCPVHIYQLGRQTTENVFPGTEKCTAEEWDALFREIETEGKRIKDKLKSAVEERAAMSTLRL
jgi:hypothetical protein